VFLSLENYNYFHLKTGSNLQEYITSANWENALSSAEEENYNASGFYSFVFYLSPYSIVQLQENLNHHLQKMFVSTMMTKNRKEKNLKQQV